MILFLSILCLVELFMILYLWAALCISNSQLDEANFQLHEMKHLRVKSENYIEIGNKVPN